jgi:hypothetical protein
VVHEPAVKAARHLCIALAQGPGSNIYIAVQIELICGIKWLRGPGRGRLGILPAAWYGAVLDLNESIVLDSASRMLCECGGPQQILWKPYFRPLRVILTLHGPTWSQKGQLSAEIARRTFDAGG